MVQQDPTHRLEVTELVSALLEKRYVERSDIGNLPWWVPSKRHLKQIKRIFPLILENVKNPKPSWLPDQSLGRGSLWVGRVV